MRLGIDSLLGREYSLERAWHVHVHVRTHTQARTRTHTQYVTCTCVRLCGRAASSQLQGETTPYSLLTAMFSGRGWYHAYCNLT